jgi:hypothetical protein
METPQRRSFTDDYKRQAVDLVAASGRSIGLVAKDGHRTCRRGRSCASLGCTSLARRRRDPARRLAFIGNSLPRRCGIATFTTHLHQAISASRSDLEASIVADDRSRSIL